eukprot:g856.t1
MSNLCILLLPYSIVSLAPVCSLEPEFKPGLPTKALFSMRSITMMAALALYTSICVLSPADAKMFSFSDIFGGKKQANTKSLKEKRSWESYYATVYGADVMHHKYGDGGGGNNNNNNKDNNGKDCECNVCAEDDGNDGGNQNECSCETNGMKYPGEDTETYWYVKYVYSSSDCSDSSLVGVKNEYTDDSATCMTYGQKDGGMGGSMNNNNKNQQESAEDAAQCTLREEKNGITVYEKRFCSIGIVRTPPGVKAVRVEGYWKDCCDQNLRVVIYAVQGCNQLYGNTNLICVNGDGNNKEGRRRRLAGDDMNNNGNNNNNNGNMGNDDMNNNGNNNNNNNGDMGNDDMGDMDDGDMEDMDDMDDMEEEKQEGSNSDFYISFCDEDDTTCSGDCETYEYNPRKCYYEGDMGGYRHKYYKCWDDSDNAWVEEYNEYTQQTSADETYTDDDETGTSNKAYTPVDETGTSNKAYTPVDETGTSNKAYTAVDDDTEDMDDKTYFKSTTTTTTTTTERPWWYSTTTTSSRKVYTDATTTTTTDRPWWQSTTTTTTTTTPPPFKSTTTTTTERPWWQSTTTTSSRKVYTDVDDTANTDDKNYFKSTTTTTTPPSFRSTTTTTTERPWWQSTTTTSSRNRWPSYSAVKTANVDKKTINLAKQYQRKQDELGVSNRQREIS